MFAKLSILTLLVGVVVAFSSAFAEKPADTADDDKGLHCWLYSGKYHNFATVEEGCTTLPRSVIWQVDDTTGYPDRITLRLRDGDFLPLVSQMDVDTAKRLHHELGKMIESHESRRSR